MDIKVIYFHECPLDTQYVLEGKSLILKSRHSERIYIFDVEMMKEKTG